MKDQFVSQRTSYQCIKAFEALKVDNTKSFYKFTQGVLYGKQALTLCYQKDVGM